jgi:DNA topoisomerase-2
LSFNDDKRKTTGDRNGYGAKLANIFSMEFVAECLDAGQELKFRQVFCGNMHVMCKPVIETCSKAKAKGKDFTKISFRPDFA